MLFIVCIVLLTAELSFGMVGENKKIFQPKSLLLFALQATSTTEADLSILPKELRIAALLLKKNNGNAEKAFVDAVDRRITRLQALKKIELESCDVEFDLVTQQHKHDMVSNISFFGIETFLRSGVNPNVEDSLGCTALELAHEHEDEGLKAMIWLNNPTNVELRMLQT